MAKPYFEESIDTTTADLHGISQNSSARLRSITHFCSWSQTFSNLPNDTLTFSDVAWFFPFPPHTPSFGRFGAEVPWAFKKKKKKERWQTGRFDKCQIYSKSHFLRISLWFHFLQRWVTGCQKSSANGEFQTSRRDRFYFSFNFDWSVLYPVTIWEQRT